MSIFQAMILGLVQGLLEFLPISSSGHLILASRVLGWPDQGLAFDMAAHAGSMVAIVAYLRRDVVALVRGALDLVRWRHSDEARLALQLAVASIPVVVAGALLIDFVATSGRSLAVLGVTSILFGALLWAADLYARRTTAGRKDVDAETVRAPWSWRSMLVAGAAQALAVIPGTSRSGVTMSAALFDGLSRTRAARLSFLLSLPVGLLVAAKDGWEIVADPSAVGGWAALGVGFVAAAVSAYLAIDWLLRWLKRRGFGGFALYRIALGVVLLMFHWRG